MSNIGIKMLGASMLTALPWSVYAQDIIPPKMYTTTPGGINVSDGTFRYSVTDLSIGTISLQRYHVPGIQKPNSPLIGKNMSHNFDIYVAPNRRSVLDPYRPIVHIGDSASGVYEQSSSTPITISPYNQDAERSGRLALSGGNYVYTDRDGAVYTFTSSVPAAGVPWNSQRVSQITYPEGRVQTFSYNASNQLKLVKDTAGYAIVFDYNAAGDVAAACGFNTAQIYVSASSTCVGAALKVSYGYDANRVLTSFIDVDGQVTTYTGTVSTVSCVKPPSYSICKISNSSTQQTLGDGSVWNFMGGTLEVNDPEGVPAFDGDSSGSVTDPDGKTTSFSFTKTSPYTMTDPNGNVTQYRFAGSMLFNYTGAPYHDGTMLIEAILPEGNKYLAEYNGPLRSITKETMVAKPGAGLSDVVKDYGYASSCTVPPDTYQNCTKPRWIKDAKGNQTDYTYATHGAVLTEMRPAPSAGASRPLKVLTYVQKYAYIKDALGALVPASAPIWMPSTETICQTVAGVSPSAVCDPAAPQMVTTYEYGANGTAGNLLVHGKVVSWGGASLRTCYGYDERGNQVSETKPRAGLALCA